MKTIVIIPARLNSSRLPNKVILDICGKPMIQHVYESTKKVKNISEVYIATDSEKVKQICEKFTSHVIMTSNEHESGTDRLAEAVENINCDNVINVQGDEPLISSELISNLASSLESKDIDMISAMYRIKTVSDLKSKNSVKVTVDKKLNALYFSRSIIPWDRDELDSFLTEREIIPSSLNFFKHIGIYGYKKEFLKKYSLMEQTYLEKLEKLEQLRVLENGYRIKMLETDYEPVGVDVQEDLEKVRKIIECR